MKSTLLLTSGWRLVMKALPFIISLVSTSVIFSVLVNFHPVIGTVSTEVISVWI